MAQIDAKTIFETSLQWMNRNGFEQTTLEDLANASNLEVSEFLKFFSSKEQIIQTFYNQNCQDLELKANEIVLQTTSFEERFKNLLYYRLISLQPQRDSVLNISALAVNPRSPLSAFGQSSSELRKKCIQINQMLIEGSDFCCHPELKKFVPTLLWFYMGAILFFWVHDESEECSQSFKMIDSLTPLVLRTMATSRFSFAATAVRPVIKLLNEFIVVK